MHKRCNFRLNIFKISIFSSRFTDHAQNIQYILYIHVFINENYLRTERQAYQKEEKNGQIETMVHRNSSTRK